ncbi:hypothetical protein [Rhodobacter sp. NSM]|uniref:hypothetical protein n=1 Tax=Rhodobacter sp. NSM TaxID=3457501 RepID=UPI003FD35D4D
MTERETPGARLIEVPHPRLLSDEALPHLHAGRDDGPSLRDPLSLPPSGGRDRSLPAAEEAHDAA